MSDYHVGSSTATNMWGIKILVATITVPLSQYEIHVWKGIDINTSAQCCFTRGLLPITG